MILMRQNSFWKKNRRTGRVVNLIADSDINLSLDILDESEFKRVKEQKYFEEIAKNGLRQGKVLVIRNNSCNRLGKHEFSCDITCQVEGMDDMAAKLKTIMNCITQLPITAKCDFFFWAHSLTR